MFPHSNSLSVRLALCAAVSLITLPVFAGADISYNDSKKTIIEPEKPELRYEAGRGLITLEGPSGMFINPTSATLPKGKFTAQYCDFIPEEDTDVVGHGLMLAYGVTDWLEVGAVGNFVDQNEPIERQFAAGGPMIRIRLLRDKSWWPQVSVGAYAKLGNEKLNQGSVYIAAYKRIPIMEDGFLKSLGFHAGYRHSWFTTPVNTHG